MHAMRLAVFLFVSLIIASSARATYSIVVADTRTGWVGGAVTSCVGDQSLGTVFQGVPGVGAVHSQAYSSSLGRAHAAYLLALGERPADIISAITSTEFDALAAHRQYGIVRLDGLAAGHTGESTGTYAADMQGMVDGYAYSLQGNILTGSDVFTQIVSRLGGDACDLPELLMTALEAGAMNGQGDARCTEVSGIPSDSAYLHVFAPDGTSVLELAIDGTGDESAVEALRALFGEWRAAHPCQRPLMCEVGST